MKRNYVLCVDDDPDDCALLGEALTQLRPDIELQFVHNSDDAMRMLSSPGDLPSLIVMDINMPGLDGKETFLALRKDDRLRKIPVVLMSTNVRDPDLSQMEHNGTTILKKPDNFSGYEEIAKTIIHLLY